MLATNFVFCPPLQGKPNPQEPKPEGKDTRGRVIQLGSKDNTCVYATYNLLRERWKAPNMGGNPHRQFEQLVSKMRKEISASERALPNIANQLNDPIAQRFLTSITKQSLQTMGPLINFLDGTAKEMGMESMLFFVPLENAIPGFKEQLKHQNLFEYLKYLKLCKREEIFLEFFKKVGVDPKNFYERLKQIDPNHFEHHYEKKEWESLDEYKRLSLLGYLAWHVVAMRYGFKVSLWSPSQPFEALVQELQTHGPLVVAGCFGRLQYSVSERKLNRKVMGRELFGWNKADPRNPNPSVGHTILLVGAETIGTRNYVYYIDPEDTSDPAHPEQQRVFCMSYERAVEGICDRYGIIRGNAPKEIGFALYYPQLE